MGTFTLCLRSLWTRQFCPFYYVNWTFSMRNRCHILCGATFCANENSSRGKNLTQGQNLTQKIISDTHSIQALKEGRQGFVYTRKRGLWTFTARTDNKTLAPDRVIWRASLEIPVFFMENDPPQAQMCLRTHPILPTPQGSLSSLFHRIDGVCRGLWRSKNWLVFNFLK